MNQQEFDIIRGGGREVVTKPRVFFAKRIKKVRCLNPRARIQYHYDRVHEMTFEDGTKLVKCEDHWRRPGVQMKAGNYVLVSAVGLVEVYLTPDQFAAEYDFVK